MRIGSNRLLVAGATAAAAAGLWALTRTGGKREGKAAAAPYAPLDVPKPVADGVWIVDSGPIDAMGLSLPVRMTIVRLTNGDLLLHSPTCHTPALGAAVAALGPVRHLVAPNVAHWTFLAGWQRACPEATVWAVPGLGKRAQVQASTLRIDAELGDTAPPAWADAIDQGIVTGGAGFTEMWFFHKPSRTLLLVDLIENLEPRTLPPVARLLMRAAAATSGTTARYLRLPVRLGGAPAREAIRTIVALAPERVIFAHGTPFDHDGAARLRRAFDWLV